MAPYLFLFIYVRFGFWQLAPIPIGSGTWLRYLWWKQVTEASKRSHSCTCEPCTDMFYGYMSGAGVVVVNGSILLFLSSGLLTSQEARFKTLVFCLVYHWHRCYMGFMATL